MPTQSTFDDKYLAQHSSISQAAELDAFDHGMSSGEKGNVISVARERINNAIGEAAHTGEACLLMRDNQH